MSDLQLMTAKSLRLLDEIATQPRILSQDEILSLRNDIQRLLSEVVELQQTFDLRWRADMRAIKRWQEDGPGRSLTWPDHADLVVWLLERLEDVGSSFHTESLDEF